MIPVTKPHLPSKEVYKSYIDKIYESGYLTNNGPLVQELESKLQERWKVKNVILVSNGTLALQILYKALGITKKAITTPFSFIATASSLKWEGIEPVFIDIKETDLTLDPYLVEQVHDGDVEAIVPVHVYGNPCDVKAFDNIAKNKGWKVIYDAAHAFDVELDGESIFKWGDASTLSFHATKLFHTVEGGAIITECDELAEKVRSLINFGMINGEVVDVGINAKMSEFHAAMGLTMLAEINDVINYRKTLLNTYVQNLPLNATSLLTTSFNGSYIPVSFTSTEDMNDVERKLQLQNVYPRRYFSPSLDSVPCLVGRNDCKVSNSISSKVLCLPLYSELSIQEVKNICEYIK